VNHVQVISYNFYLLLRGEKYILSNKQKMEPRLIYYHHQKNKKMLSELYRQRTKCLSIESSLIEISKRLRDTTEASRL
jgi:hypothetical protein